MRDFLSANLNGIVFYINLTLHANECTSRFWL